MSTEEGEVDSELMDEFEEYSIEDIAEELEEEEELESEGESTKT